MTSTDEPRTTRRAGTRPPASSVIADRVVAAVAAHSAVTVAGVVRVEPGLLGLAGSLTRSVRGWVTGLSPAPAAGVRARVEPADAPGGGRTWVEIDIATSGQDQVASVGRAVQRAVTRAVTAATGLTVVEVTVSILDIHIGPVGAR